MEMFQSGEVCYYLNGKQTQGQTWFQNIGEDEVRDFEPEGEIEEKEEYDYFSTFDEESGIYVVVEAPMGSLPLLAELRVEPVDAEAIRDAVNSVLSALRARGVLEDE